MPDYLDIPTIGYEGPDSDNPLGFKHYDPDEVVGGRPMREHLRFGAAFWHCMRGTGADPFGGETMLKPWDDGSATLANARKRARVFFEFLTKCGIDFYCFHDFDVAPEASTLKQSLKNMDAMAVELGKLQDRSGKKLLWGTACLFANRRYLHGAATSCSADVYAIAGAQVKKAMDVTHALGGAGYTFWGGREGYATLLNTDMKREMDHLAAFLHMAVDYKKKIGFNGQFYIEPKPQEPTTHQYDSDAAACLNFLREYGLLEHFKLNIETNHATLAGHTMEHELTVAANAGALGSIDANMGTDHVGWDTDQFPTDLYLATQVMLVLLRHGGFTTGGLNFDAKRRRESFDPIDLFYAHIAGMDTFARGLKIAHRIQEDGHLDRFLSHRYRSWDKGIGKKVESGKCTLADLERHALNQKEPILESGRQEMLEALVNGYI